MIKSKLFFFVFFTVFASCAIWRKPHINLPEKKAVVRNMTIDSSAHYLQKLLAHNIDFNSIQLKFKINYSDTTRSENVIAIIRMRRDSLIWVSITAPIGVEGVRMLVTKDSIKIIDRLEKANYSFDFKYLYQFIPPGTTLHNLQDLIIGNAMFIDTSKPNMQRSDSLYLLQTLFGALRTSVWYGPQSYKLFKYVLNDSSQNLIVSARFTDYTAINDKLIPSVRSYILKRSGRAIIEAELKEVKYNELLSYPFKTRYK